MPTTLRRAVGASLLAALVAPLVAVGPAHAAGPVVIDVHDSHVPARAFDLSSTSAGTLYSTDSVGDHGRIYVVNGSMTTGSAPIDLGPGQWAAFPPQLRANRVVIPQGSSSAAPVTSVKSCTLGSCPVLTTLAAPAGTEYVGHGQDVALFWSGGATSSTLWLRTWTGTAVASYVLPGITSRPDFAEGDTTGIVVAAGGDVLYVNRTTGDVTVLGFGNDVRLTPTYAVWWAMGVGEAEPYRTKVWRIPRSSVTGTPSETTLPGDPSIELLVANDTGFAYLVPNGDADGTKGLYSAAWDSPPVAYARPLTTSALAPFQDGAQFLINDRLAGIPGFYRLSAGAPSGTLTGLAPVRPANTQALAASNGRAVYIDDMTATYPMFARSVLGGVLGPESIVTGDTAGGALALSGPYVAFTRPGTTGTTTRVVFGRVEGPHTTVTLPVAEVGTVGISGRTVYVTNGARARLIDVLTGATTDLGRSYVGVFGRYAVTLNYDTGEIRRRDLVTGATQLVSPAIAGCPVRCIDEERAQVAVWGNEVVYAFQAQAGPPTVAALWSGDTGTSYSLSPLVVSGEPNWYELKYWAGLLLVSHVGGDVKLYDVRTFAPSDERLLDNDAERPLALDGHVAGWRPNDDLRARVQPITEHYTGYDPAPRYLGAVAPAGFGPGVGTGTWAPAWLVSQDVSWRVEVKSPGGTLVHMDDGISENGEARMKPWDGTNADTGQPLPQGTYTWTLVGESPGGSPLRLADGSDAPITGTVYVSGAPLAAPAVSSPTRTTDVSATTSFPVTWTAPAGAPAGTTFQLYRSSNGGAFTLYATTAARTFTAGTVPGTTYRFRVRAVDPAGRAGAFSGTDTTMAPYDDTSATVAGSWATSRSASFYRGSQRRASAAGATLSLRATGTQIHLIGTKAASYGQFQVSIDGGAYSAPIDTRSASTRYRQVLYSRTGLAAGTHTVKIRVVGTSGRPYVGIDGIAFLR